MKRQSLPFARKVHQRMQERGLGLREFCRSVGLDPSFFSKVLAGKRSPPSDEADLRRIAEILQIDAPSLIVAAGRIPSEWQRLWNDRALFQEVHRLAAGQAGSAPSPARGTWRRSSSGPTASDMAMRPAPRDRPYSLPAAPQKFGEELL